MVALSTDHQLLQAFATRRCERSLALLIDRHLVMVRGVAMRLLHDPAAADDTIQTTFATLAQQALCVLEGLDPSGSLAPWLCRVATNEALQIRRGNLRRQKREQLAARACRVREEAVESESLRLLHEELQSLPARYQEPVVLCYLTGETQESAAALLSVSRSTLKRRLKNALSLLRSRLERRGCTLPALAIVLLATSTERSATAGTSSAGQSLAAKAISAVPAVSATTTSVSIVFLRSLRAMNTLTLLKTSVVATGIASCLALGVMAANDPESPVDVNRSATAQADKPASRAAVPQVETDEASPLAGTAAQPAEPASDNDSPKEPEPTRSGKKKSRQGARNKGNSDSKSPRVSGNRNQASTPSTEPRPRAATPNDGSKSGGFATSGGTSSARGSSMSASGGRSGGGGSSSSMARSGGGTGGATSAGGTGGKSFKGTTNRNGRQFQTNDSLQVPDFEAIFQQMQREASEASGLPFPVGAESSSFHGTLTINGETMEFDSAEEYEAARRKHGLHLPTLPQ